MGLLPFSEARQTCGMGPAKVRGCTMRLPTRAARVDTEEDRGTRRACLVVCKSKSRQRVRPAQQLSGCGGERFGVPCICRFAEPPRAERDSFNWDKPESQNALGGAGATTVSNPRGASADDRRRSDAV